MEKLQTARKMQRPGGWNKEQADEIIAHHRETEGPALPILHALQDAFGFISDEAILAVAAALNLTRAEVYGIASFYHDFRRAPAGRHVLKLCRAEACQSMGAEALADHVRAALQVDWHGTTDNGALTLEPVFCLGLCACAPAAMLDGELAGRLDRAGVDALLEQARR